MTQPVSGSYCDPRGSVAGQQCSLCDRVCLAAVAVPVQHYFAAQLEPGLRRHHQAGAWHDRRLGNMEPGANRDGGNLYTLPHGRSSLASSAKFPPRPFRTHGALAVIQLRHGHCSLLRSRSLAATIHDVAPGIAAGSSCPRRRPVHYSSR